MINTVSTKFKLHPRHITNLSLYNYLNVKIFISLQQVPFDIILSISNGHNCRINASYISYYRYVNQI